MAHDIVPIELGLTQGNVVTLWAPRWREEGEEWEAFLGLDDKLYVFPDVAQLAAFVRSQQQHDLADHPSWRFIPELPIADLIPDENHKFDLVGMPELVGEDADEPNVSEVAEIVAMTSSLAEVCDLESVHKVLDSHKAFPALSRGIRTFRGREGEELWSQLGDVIADKWDNVIDAIDNIVTTPRVNSKALKAAQKEYDELLVSVVEEEAPPAANSDDFWAEVGIDPIKIITGAGEYYTLRCYLDDEPLFLGDQRKIEVFSSTRALARYLAEDHSTDISRVSTWERVSVKATSGELSIQVDPENVYVLAGIDQDISAGVDAIDPAQLDLAVELLTDAAQWVGDDSVAHALDQSESLGWLVSFVLEPGPMRLAPSAPYDAEAEQWRDLVTAFENRLNIN